MSDIASRRFTPASLRDFTAAARDLAAAYGLNLSAAQEHLARIYGFEDFHELRSAVAKHLPPGPYRGETSLAVAFNRWDARYLEDRDRRNPIWPVGRRGADDLALYDRPEERRARLQFQDAIDLELDPDFVAIATNLTVDEYVGFEIDHIDQLGERWIEGKFRQTTVGRRVWEALQYLTEGFEEIMDEDERQRIADQVERIMKNHPNNPYPGAALVGLYGYNREWTGSKADAEAAAWLTGIAKRSIDLFCAVIPKGFRSLIEPKLVGHWLENYSYHSVLYYGGVAAHACGEAKLGDQWFRRGYRACKQDPFGFRFALWLSSPDAELRGIAI